MRCGDNKIPSHECMFNVSLEQDETDRIRCCSLVIGPVVGGLNNHISICLYYSGCSPVHCLFV